MTPLSPFTNSGSSDRDLAHFFDGLMPKHVLENRGAKRFDVTCRLARSDAQGLTFFVLAQSVDERAFSHLTSKGDDEPENGWPEAKL